MHGITCEFLNVGFIFQLSYTYLDTGWWTGGGNQPWISWPGDVSSFQWSADRSLPPASTQVRMVGCDSQMRVHPLARCGKCPTCGQKALGGKHGRSIGKLAAPWNNKKSSFGVDLTRMPLISRKPEFLLMGFFGQTWKAQVPDQPLPFLWLSLVCL